MKQPPDDYMISPVIIS